jgi:hypothetical protein
MAENKNFRLETGNTRKHAIQPRQGEDWENQPEIQDRASISFLRIQPKSVLVKQSEFYF